MFDHYYEISSDNSLFQDYFKWLEDDEVMRKGVKSFKKQYGILGDTFMYRCGKLWVDVSKNMQFAEQFCKESEQGHSPFKKTSPIGKAFTKANIVKASKPFLPFYFKNPVGKSLTRLFDYNGKLYAQYSTEFEIDDVPKGFVPLKASNFYKVIEEIENKDGEQND